MSYSALEASRARAREARSLRLAVFDSEGSENTALYAHSDPWETWHTIGEISAVKRVYAVVRNNTWDERPKTVWTKPGYFEPRKREISKADVEAVLSVWLLEETADKCMCKFSLGPSVATVCGIVHLRWVDRVSLGSRAERRRHRGAAERRNFRRAADWFRRAPCP